MNKLAIGDVLCHVECHPWGKVFFGIIDSAYKPCIQINFSRLTIEGDRIIIEGSERRTSEIVSATISKLNSLDGKWIVYDICYKKGNQE